ncbi:hypothetical protein [Bacillus sp. AFS031507]|uniref:hypothetical protein n=1 Tax=Bacillus sp. AFS031507 TaxID=2033496 RepID=UPI000BFC97ED|nr:hypothetical protein [Bacillus sp. AFS031507]PGY07779.1 hypothetical protein COE25_23250 [Bacillus sp. AFS031507]
MERAIYEKEKIDTMNKPFLVCWLVFGPKDCCNLIVGETNKVKCYWESLEVSYDFQWFIFDTNEQMELGIKQIASEPTPFTTWMLYKVEDCIKGKIPDEKFGVDLGNPREPWLFN